MKFVFSMRMVKLLFYAYVGVMYMNMLGALCMYIEFVFRWCAGRCECVEVIDDISIVCVSHCVILVQRILVVGGYLCEV